MTNVSTFLRRPCKDWTGRVLDADGVQLFEMVL
jgi:hypothetical protein